MKTAEELWNHIPVNERRDQDRRSAWVKGYNALYRDTPRFEGSLRQRKDVVQAWLGGWDYAKAEKVRETGARQYRDVGPGTIIVNSIGCGLSLFYQVIKRSGDTVTARELDVRYTERINQTALARPIKDSFQENGSTVRLRLKIGHYGALQIGPIKRMVWWSVWDGKPLYQWSP